MKIFWFTQQDMVSFGNYLLSEERTQLVLSNPEFSEEQKQENLKQVSHADVSNWFDDQIVELGDQ